MINKKGSIVLIFLVVGIISLGLLSLFFLKDFLPVKNPSNADEVASSQYFLKKYDFENFRLENLVSSKNINRALVSGKNTWIATDGGILQFDTDSGKQIAVNNKEKFPCPVADVLKLKEYWFVSCSGEYSSETGEAKDNAIYQFEPNFKKIVYKYTPDKFKDLRSIRIYSDGEYLWVGTYEGVNRIDPENHKIKTYTTELNINATHWGVDTILISGKEVWAIIGANIDSEGGIARYNRQNDTWTSYQYKDFSENLDILNSLDRRIDFDHDEITDDAVWIGYQDPTLGGLEKVRKFVFDNNKWEPMPGKFTDYFKIPPDNNSIFYSHQEEKGFSETPLNVQNGNVQLTLKIPEKGDVSISFDKRSYFKSENRQDKYFILASDGILTFTKDDNFPKKIKSFDFGTDLGIESNYIVAQDGSFAIVMGLVGGAGYPTRYINYVPLDNQKDVVTYSDELTEKNESSEREIFDKYTVKKEGTNIYLLLPDSSSNEYSKIFNIDTSLGKITNI